MRIQMRLSNEITILLLEEKIFQLRYNNAKFTFGNIVDKYIITSSDKEDDFWLNLYEKYKYSKYFDDDSYVSPTTLNLNEDTFNAFKDKMVGIFGDRAKYSSFSVRMAIVSRIKL